MRRGDVLRVHRLRGRWGVPQVTLRGDDGGLSADGSTLVLARWPSSRLPARSRFAVLDLRRMRTRIVTIAGAFSFDALSPDGRRLYLIEQLSARDLTRYRVRAYDLAAGRLLSRSIVDPRDDERSMRGYPLSRVEGRGPSFGWAYTLYTTGRRLFVHALDTRHGRARCVDLPWRRAVDGTLALTRGGRALVVRSRGHRTIRLDLRRLEERGGEARHAAARQTGAAPKTLLAAGASVVTAAALLLTRRRRRR